MKLYIDLRHSFAVSKVSGKFNGGNNSAQNMLNLLWDSYKDIMVICHDSLTAEYLAQRYQIESSVFVITNKLSDIKYEENSVYFNPQAKDSNDFLKEIISLKKSNPTVKIKLTIHDRRHHEDIIDKYNGLLNEGVKSNFLFLGIGRFVNSIKKDRIVKKLLEISDEIYTVSNYSMQQLLGLSNPKSIIYYTQGILFKEIRNLPTDNYILFVSAGRAEKNFIRSLKAFEKYVSKSNNETVKLKVTGLNDRQKEILRKKCIINGKVMENQVELLGYVDSAALADLYVRCRFLLFTSKSEGFGLPVSEAIFFERPVVASRKASIPEVAGSVAIYVDPYSIDSISDGIEKMMDEITYNEYLDYVKIKKEILKNQIQLDEKIIVNSILRYDK